MFCSEQISTTMQMPGGHAQYMTAYADSTVLLPEGLSYEQAAPIFCAGYTVWSGLRIADPKPHETVAVVGVGGLGHLAVQYAKASVFRPSPFHGRPTKTSSCGRWVPTRWCETARAFLLRVELTSSLGRATQTMPWSIASRDFGRMVALY